MTTEKYREIKRDDKNDIQRETSEQRKGLPHVMVSERERKLQTLFFLSPYDS